MKGRLVLFFCLVSFNLFSQGIDNLWLMGGYSWAGPPNYGGIDMNFTGGNLNITYQNRLMNFECTNGVICNSSGDFLFSSNGIYIMNAVNDTMVNGSGLNPAYFTSLKDSFGLTIPQANLIIPFPSDSTKYYLFHETSDDYGNTFSAFYLYYSIIDMSQDSGRGAVIQKNVVLLNDTLLDGRLTACKHANGRDWWLVCHKNLSNKYCTFLITPSGIEGPYFQNIGQYREDFFGQVVFSPDGNKFAFYEPYLSDLDVMDFDRCTGQFSNPINIAINDSAIGGGAAFSPNSQVLYVSSMNYVYQFDVTAPNVAATQTTVATYDGFISHFATGFYLSQLAPDGKIYINCGNSTQDIHVINYPDSIGLGCDVCQHCIHLPAINFFTIANHPNYFLGGVASGICDSLGLGIQPTIVSVTNGLRLYPNPVSNTSEEIIFTYPSTGEHSIIVINNIERKEVARYYLPLWSSVQHVKLPKLSSGIYLARLLSNKSSANVKFFVE